MTTILETIEDKYSYDDEDYGFIVFVSSSPEAKKGMYPPIMTLCDYDIDSVGALELNSRRLSHIAELDLTDNLLSDWKEIFTLLDAFPGLEFLNLSNNLLCETIQEKEINSSVIAKKQLPTRKLVLNGNKVDWQSVNLLMQRMPQLEQLYLSTNNLVNPASSSGSNVFQHNNLRQLFLSCNPLDNFDTISENVGQHCANLELLSLAECPVNNIPVESAFHRLISLNLSTTSIGSWQEVDKLRSMKALKVLRLQHCPVLHEYTAHERRMMLIARLPNVEVLNGGGKITDNEREDAERAFIRYYMDLEERPARYDELIQIHGKLDHLVNIDMSPDTHVKVKVCHKEEVREEVIKVYQTVQQFKALVHQWFEIPPQNMKLYYCDKDLVELAGPEEMKWPQKALYTYNVQNGDKFIVDEKVNLSRIRVRNTSTSSMLGVSPGSRGGDSPGRISFILSPKRVGSNNNIKSASSPRSKVSRNLFGAEKQQRKKSPQGN